MTDDALLVDCATAIGEERSSQAHHLLSPPFASASSVFGLHDEPRREFRGRHAVELDGVSEFCPTLSACGEPCAQDPTGREPADLPVEQSTKFEW